MSNRSHLLDLPNDTDPQGDQPSLLFHASPSSRSAIARLADGTPTGDGHPNDMAQSQEPLRSDVAPMSPSGPSTVYSHHPAPSSLGVPRWNSNEMNQWPYRLFTTAPPTPSGGSTLPLGSFRVPPRQQDLEDLQDPLQLPLPPTDPTPQFVGQLSPTNLRVYDNCRGNRPSLWPTIAKEIFNLQERYGELIIFINGTQRDPRYRCGVCSHTTQPVHTKPKRRWDSSPDILSHGDHKIKPWFSNCGRAFPRHRDQRRHSAKCKLCNPGQQFCASPVQSSLASTPSFSPRPSLPSIPPYNDVPQEPVIPRSPVANHNPHPGGYPALSPSNMFDAREPAPPLYYPHNQWLQPMDPQWARYSHTQGPPAGGYHVSRPYNGIANVVQGEYMYVPAVNFNGGNQYPSYHPFDAGTGGRGMAPLDYLGHPNYMAFLPSIPVLRETPPLGSNPPNVLPPAPAPSQYGTSGPRQDLWRQDVPHGYGEKVCASVNVSEQPAKEALEWRRKRVNRSHLLTAVILSLVILSVLFWFFVRYFLIRNGPTSTT